MNNKKPHRIDPADKAKGDRAELRFRQWLDADVLPHLYIDQTPMSVPAPMRGQIKRPDYIVGVPGVGAVAFDVKAKGIFNGHLVFDLEEVRRLRLFARVFHMTVYFACLDPDGGHLSYWVRLDQLDFIRPVELNGYPALPMSLDRALPVSLDRSFHEAFVDAVALA